MDLQTAGGTIAPDNTTSTNRISIGTITNTTSKIITAGHTAYAVIKDVTAKQKWRGIKTMPPCATNWVAVPRV
eukprot:11071116-Ditylum_brightwellii.AAC.1